VYVSLILVLGSSAHDQGVVFFVAVDKVTYINPEKLRQLVRNFSNHITGKLYISEIPFQWYKECAKWTLESNVMAKI
jgi:hypothetical protein